MTPAELSIGVPLLILLTIAEAFSWDLVIARGLRSMDVLLVLATSCTLITWGALLTQIWC